MKKAYSITMFLVLAAIIAAITLTSGITKERSGGYKDLVEELYDQAIKQNDNLGSIEDGIEKFYKKRAEAVEKYNSFTAYNSRYYSDAKTNTASIADAAIKQKATDIISTSENNYKARLTDWQTTIANLNANEKELRDLHVLLKVKVTEIMIEKYQNAEYPDNAKVKETSSDLLKLIERIKVIIR